MGALGGAALSVFFSRRGGSSPPLQQFVFVNGAVSAVSGALLLGLSNGFAGFLLFTGLGAGLGYDLSRMPASGLTSKLAVWLTRRRDTLQRRGWLPLSSARPALEQPIKTLRRTAATPAGRGTLVGAVAGLLFAILMTSSVGFIVAFVLLGLSALVGRRYAKRYTPYQSPQTATIIGLVAAIPGVLLVSGLLGSLLGWGLLVALSGYGGRRIAKAQQQGRSWRETVLGWVDGGIGVLRGARNALPNR
ncbi:MAG: hypothetical protein U5L04_06985 [Trueperaceae bacterium]|nr:hypothetical protein [Trueperaceae bacterium]